MSCATASAPARVPMLCAPSKRRAWAQMPETSSDQVEGGAAAVDGVEWSATTVASITVATVDSVAVTARTHLDGRNRHPAALFALTPSIERNCPRRANCDLTIGEESEIQRLIRTEGRVRSGRHATHVTIEPYFPDGRIPTSGPFGREIRPGGPQRSRTEEPCMWALRPTFFAHIAL